MKLHDENRKVTGLENFDTIQHTIKKKNMGVIMSILTQKTYTDKIGAVVRELGANGLDSHKQAGKAHLPITMTLPTALEPTFKVLDEGLGMSKDFLDKEYTSLGESTKRDDDDAIGGFGIGRLSPFCYTDAFSVCSVFGGVEYNYTLQMDKTSNVVSIPVGEMPTEKPCGVEVTVPVAINDIQKFRAKILEIVKYYDVTPILINSGDEFMPLKKVAEEPTWFLSEDNVDAYGYVRNGSNAHAIVGGVKYALSYESLNISDNDIRLALGCGKLFFKFGIGDVSIPPSRETLEMDRKTVDAIIAAVAQVKTDISNIILNKLDSLPTIIDAIKFASEIKSNFSFANLSLDKILYKGTPLYTETRPRLEKEVAITNDAQEIRKSMYVFKPEYYSYRKDSSEKPTRDKHTSNINIINPETCIVIMDGVSRMGISQRLAGLKINGFKKFLILDTEEFMFKDFWTLHGFDHFPQGKIFYASKLERVGMAIRAKGEGRGSKKNVKAFKLRESNSRFISYHWDDAVMPEDDGVKYYLPIKGYNIVEDDIHDSVYFLRSINYLRQKMNITSEPVYGIRAKDVASLPSNWKPFRPELYLRMEKFIQDNEENIKKMSLSNLRYSSDMNWITNVHESVCRSHAIYKMGEEVRNIDGWSSKAFDAIMNQCQSSLIKGMDKISEMVEKFKKEPSDLPQKVESLGKRYPMLRFVRSADAEIIKEYVKLVDSVTPAM